MKISPIKDYAKPKYAVKLAALLAAAVSVSACAEGGGKPVNTSAATTAGGAGYKAETTDDATVVGKYPATEELRLEGDVAFTEDSTSEGDVTTDEPQVDGYLDVPEDVTTTAVAATTTVAVTTTLSGTSHVSENTKYEEPELAGEETTCEETTCDEPRIEGGVGAPESTKYEEPELMGDFPVDEEYYETATAGVVPAPEEPRSKGYDFAKRNLSALMDAFESRTISFRFIEDFEDPGQGRFRITDANGKTYDVPAPYLIENKYAENYTDKYVAVTYMTSDDDYAGFIRKHGTKLCGAYLYADESTGMRLVLIDYDGDGADLDRDACEKLAQSYAKWAEQLS